MRFPLGIELRKRQPPAGAAGRDSASALEDAVRDVQTGGPDVNPQLTGRAKYSVYQEMRLSDSAVRSALWTCKLPIRSAAWDVEPVSDDPVDRLVCDACRAQLGLRGEDGWLDVTFDGILQFALLSLDWGAMFGELVWSDKLVDWRDADGDTHPIRPIVRVAPRYPATVAEVRTDAAGRIIEMRQDLPGTRPIPADKLVHIMVEREGWWGVSLLRPMWGPWRLKKALMVSAGLAYDRFAAGVPVVRYPQGGGQMVQQRAQQIGQNIRQHERAYVVLEGPPEAGWDVTLLRGSDTIADPVPLLHYYNRAIGEAALQQFSSLGTTERGARAVGEVLADPFWLACQAIASTVADDLRRQLVRRFVDHNFGTHIPTPRITASRIQARSVETLARALADLADAGLNFTDRATQNDIRDQLELPLLPLLPGEAGIEPTLAREGDGLRLPGTED